MYIGLHMKYLLYLSDFIERGVFSIYLEEKSNAKFHEDPSSGSAELFMRTGGRTDRRTDRQT
jgi:hypothetical protein